MTRKNSPSSVMYARLKEFGISNHDAAQLLLNTQLTFGGRTLASRIDDSSQLSRRIVHTAPGEMPQALFNDFAQSCAVIGQRARQRLLASMPTADARLLHETFLRLMEGECASQMEMALRAYGMDDGLYRNAIVFIRRAELPHEEDRALLHLMLFVSTGCLGNPRTSSSLVVDYATDVLGAEFHTASTLVGSGHVPDGAVHERMGLLRVVGGYVAGGSRFYVLHADGTYVGLLPDDDHGIADVDDDVSRNHAYIWCEDAHWYIRDLGSRNGTRVISGADGLERAVGSLASDRVELFASDIVCLGATTRFMVMPVME